MPDLTIGFCRSKSPASRLIEWFGADYFSHAATLLYYGKILDARLFRGVSIHDVDCGFHFIKKSVSETQYDNYITFLYDQIGLKYDIFAINRFLIGDHSDRINKLPTRWICSELIIYGLIKSGIVNQPDFFPPDRITPGALFLYLTGAGFL